MEVPAEEERFVANLIGLGKLIKEVVREAEAKGRSSVSTSLIDFVLGLIASLDKKFLLEGFIGRSHVHWKSISDRNHDFFVNNCGVIFHGAPTESVKALSLLFVLNSEGECVVPGDDMTALWEGIWSLVKVSIKYVHKNQGKYPNINSVENAKLFGLNLP